MQSAKKTIIVADDKKVNLQIGKLMPEVQLPCAKVLVVDDVVASLDVARVLMKPYKIQVDCVTSGQQAIDAIQKEEVKYNAVFMDHMMPGIDGVEATRLIRKIGTEYAATVPVIAFTANEFTGNEKLFYDAGFQDFISKPIDISQLDVIINRWVMDNPEEASTLPQEDKQAEPAKLVFDKHGQTDRRSAEIGRGIDRPLEGVDIQEGIQHLGGDEELFWEILQSFVVNIPSFIGKARNPVEDDLTEYHIAIHSIKGACRTIVAHELAKRAAKLDESAKNGDYGYIEEHNDAFLDSLEKLAASIDSLLTQMGKKI